MNVQVPAHAEFVLEGYVNPHQRQEEGPLGESTGYYLTYHNPVAKIKVITHRRDPVYHALMPFSAENRTLLFVPQEIETAIWLRKEVPAVRQVYCPNFGVVYVQIAKQSKEDVAAVINALFPYSWSPYAKVLAVFDTDVDITDEEEVVWALGSRVRPDKDIKIKPGLPGFIVDPSTVDTGETGELSQHITRTAKVAIDATKPLAELDMFEKADVPPDVQLKIARMLGI
ncbi:UbiD family decarboxylase domain-containing protein [Chloroflexota bacterium]